MFPSLVYGRFGTQHRCMSVVADLGYFKSEQILACPDAGITAYVPKPMTSGAKADGRFNNDTFVYDTAKNEYICLTGKALSWGYTNVEKGLTLHRSGVRNARIAP